MEHTANDLYARYVQAAEFFNAQVDRKYCEEKVRDLFRMKMLSQEEFAPWWAEVSADQELQARWHERFEDPAGSFARNCERIRNSLDQIPFRRVAA
jgi:hypothetical protein